LYIVEAGGNRVRKVTPAGVITTVAGTGVAGYNGDGQPAIQAQLNDPIGVAVDSAGNLHVAEQAGERVRKVTPAGIISTVAGTTATTTPPPRRH
jgi:PIN domain nuclease of toxin-antitoxin system